MQCLPIFGRTFWTWDWPFVGLLSAQDSLNVQDRQLRDTSWLGTRVKQGLCVCVCVCVLNWLTVDVTFGNSLKIEYIKKISIALDVKYKKHELDLPLNDC